MSVSGPKCKICSYHQDNYQYQCLKTLVKVQVKLFRSDLPPGLHEEAGVCDTEAHVPRPLGQDA